MIEFLQYSSPETYYRISIVLIAGAFIIEFLQYLLPAAVMCLCYGRIAYKFHHSSIFLKMILCHEEYRQKVMRRRRKTNLLLLSMAMAFVVAWLPQALLNLAKDFDTLPGFLQTQRYFVDLIAHFIAMCSIVADPMLYGALNSRFRQKVKRIFCGPRRLPNQV